MNVEAVFLKTSTLSFNVIVLTLVGSYFNATSANRNIIGREPTHVNITDGVNYATRLQHVSIQVEHKQS